MAFCAVSFAQSAPKVTKKATLLPANTQIKDLKTGEVLRVTKGTVQTSKGEAKKIIKVKMTEENANRPTNSKKPSNNLSLKQLPDNIRVLEKLSKQ